MKPHTITRWLTVFLLLVAALYLAPGQGSTNLALTALILMHLK